MPGFNPRNPSKYTGTDKNITFFVTRNRSPLGTDYRQPETGRLYTLGTVWQVGKDPSTGTEGDLWSLSKIVANVAYWVQCCSGTTPTGAVLSLSDTASTLVYPTVSGNIQLEAGTGLTVTSDSGNNKLVFSLSGGGTAVDSFTVPAGTSPVIPDANGNIDITAGAGITVTGGTNTYEIALSGGGASIDSIAVDASSGSGTNPVVPDVDGLVTVTGSQIATGTIGANVIRSNSVAVNAYQIQIQQSASSSAKDTTINGVSHYNSAQFTIDEGFVSLSTYPQATCAFSAWLNGTASNVTGDGTVYTVACDTELYDIGSNYDTGTYTFTAPVTGIYSFSILITLGNIGAITTQSFGDAGLVVNGSGTRNMFNQLFFSDDGAQYMIRSAIQMSLAAADTVTMYVNSTFVAGASKVVTVVGNTSGDVRTRFMGHLVGTT